MNITINEKLVSTLETCALNDNVSQELWVERKINSILSEVKLGNLTNAIRNDVEAYEPIILSKKAEIDLEKKELEDSIKLEDPKKPEETIIVENEEI